jgi:hypothetical protein
VMPVLETGPGVAGIADPGYNESVMPATKTCLPERDHRSRLQRVPAKSELC